MTLGPWVTRNIGVRGKANKFNAKPQIIDGVRFASIVEANRFCILKLMQKAGEISGLVPHPRFSLVVNGKLVGHYSGDASYFKRGSKKQTVEDTKSEVTRKGEAYRLRIQIFCALFPDIEFLEVTR